ncbi:Similar to Probable ubiquitin carboxyl-terminal hydrolase 5; acc. no. Q09879 [Pyronema omphalodes CBS 100304]|uniref:Similar to Probable ubiquitin carboxyl-terminal hydrolase 5 acc. no. Q09879 n=1 Tax=Pyronema omphalodes (strain CBS 100304) TaxID=1076935 RepID=U4L261_PYROM|nr:Similar to Probable ubiquitin carboxyl-terminal hydrolase 5; acc. no. Q09879 [Pyronema omphalodes CBS 100304]
MDQYLDVKICCDTEFLNHKGLDIANFDILDDVCDTKPLHVLLRGTQTIKDLIETIAKAENVQPEQLKLRRFAELSSGVIRPHELMTDLQMTIETVQKEYFTKFPECRFWLECIEPNELQTHPFFKDPTPSNPHRLLFLKYYDPLVPELLGKKHVYVDSTKKAMELVPMIAEMMKWDAGTNIQLFAEQLDFIPGLLLTRTLAEHEFENGDIIWFRKAPETKRA